MLFVLSTAFGGAQEVAKREGANIQRPVWSDDAGTLTWEANFHDKKVIELYQAAAPFSDPRRVTPAVRGSSSLTSGFAKGGGGKVAHEVSFGPTSVGRFVYSAANDLLDYDLYISGGGAVAAGPGADGGATWSPDGRWIAFTSSRTGEGDLYLVDTQTIEAPPKQLTSAPTSSELFASWSSGSDQLVYVAHTNTGDNLWTVGLDGSTTQLTTWSGNQIRPTFSPAGDKIAFYANHHERKRFDLYVTDSAGSEPTLLAAGVVPNATGPTWTPDGAHIVFVKDDDAEFDPIYAISSTDAGRHTKIDTGTVGHGDIDLAGGKLAFVAQGRVTDFRRDFTRLFVLDLPQLP